MQTTVPLLLWLQLLPAEQLTLAEHERAVTAIESWVIRRMITGANTRGYGQAFVEVLQAAQTAADAADHTVAAAVITALDQGANSLAWPTDPELGEAFVRRRAYNALTQERIRLVLGAIDEHLQRDNPKTEPATFNYDPLQIEHIMPQGWRAHWQDDQPAEPAQQTLAAQQRDQAIHSWGNLTLVTANFNRAASNAPWSAKRPELQAQSKLQLNIGPAATDTWDDAAILDRALALATVAIRVWPEAGKLT